VFADVAVGPGRVATHHRMLGSYALHDWDDARALLKQAGFTFDGVRRLSALPAVLLGIAR